MKVFKKKDLPKLRRLLLETRKVGAVRVDVVFRLGSNTYPPGVHELGTLRWNIAGRPLSYQGSMR